MQQQILQFPASIPPRDPTVREVVDLYLAIEAKVESRRSKRAWQERQRILERFVASHGDLRISQCTKAVLKIWIEGNSRLQSDWTRGRWCRTLQRVFNWAADDMELCQRNPFKGVRYRKGKRGRPLTDAEFTALCEAAGKVFLPVLLFCRLTGARPEEMAGSKWTDIGGDLEAGRAWIVRHEHKTSDREDAKPRVIGLGSEAIALLLSIRRALGVFPGFEPDHIFLNARGRPWTRNAISLRIRKLRAKLGLPADAKLYGCRHAFATSAIVNGIDIKDVADLLGHASTRMTEHYLHTAGMHNRLSELADRATKPKPTE